MSRRAAIGGFAAAGALGVYGPRSYQTVKAADASTLVVASGGDAVSLDPHVSFDGQSPLLWRAVYENLFKYYGESLEFRPCLAESFEVSEDGLTYTFKIRAGVKLSDGETLDVAAVKMSIDRQIGVQQGIAFAFASVTAVDAPDEMTVTLSLGSPSDGLLSAFAGLYAPYIIYPNAHAEHDDNGDLAQGWLRDDMVGTGPYLLEIYEQSQQAVFRRNPDYWGGWDGDHPEQIFVKYVKEPATERLLLEQGDIDIGLFLPDDLVEELDGAEGVTITDVLSFNLYYLNLPCSKGPTADKRVRQAMSYGFDYQTWIEQTMRGRAVQAHSPIPSNFVGFNPNLPQYTYDLEKAKALLAEAGYENGGFELNYVYEAGYFWKRPFGEQYQANMADLGISVNIQELSPSTWAGLLANPDTAEHAYGLVWWPSLRTPFDYLFSLFATGAQGTAGYN